MLNRSSLVQRLVASSARGVRWTTAILAALLCVGSATPGLSQVNAYTGDSNCGTNATARTDGQALSPYYNVSVGASTSTLQALCVYATRVKSVNFMPFTSDVNGLEYNPDYGASVNHDTGLNLANVGLASFATFQPTTSGGTNVVQVTFHTGYPNVALTSASQVKFLSNVKDSLGNPTPAANISNVSVSGNVLTFSIQELVDSASGHGIPEQLTIDFGSDVPTHPALYDPGADFLNSLHLFINPHPDSTNGVPGGAYAVPTGTLTAASFPTGYSAYHLAPGIYWVNNHFSFNNVELYLDDGAIIKWITPTYPTLNSGAMINYANTTGNAILRGWGIIDGQAQQQMAANTSTGQCGSSTSPLSLNSLKANSTQNALIDGITVMNSCAWNMEVWSALGTSANPVTINNIKILGFSGGDTPGNGNSDGIDIISTQYLNLTNSFIRTADDLVALDQLTSNQATAVFTGVINVVHNTFWNEVAHAMVIGGELYSAPNPNQPSLPLAVNHATFDNNTVIHDTGKAPLMSILNNWGGLVQNVIFSNNVVNQSVGLIGVDLIPATPAYGVTGYVMAASTPVSGGNSSVVAFTVTNTTGMNVIPGQAVKLAGFTSSQAVSEGFNSLYATVMASPAPTATSFSATMVVPVAVPTATSLITETAATGTLLGVPGQVGGLTFCNITQTTPQVATRVIVGNGNSLSPYVGPIPNIQFQIAMANTDPYIGGTALNVLPTPGPASFPGVTGYGSTFPQAVIQMPIFYNVNIATSNGTMQPVSTYTPGNDFYYEAADGSVNTNPATIPGNVIEQTVKQKIPYNPNATYQWNYFTSTNAGSANGGSNQVPNDMLNPNIKTGTYSCPNSSLLLHP